MPPPDCKLAKTRNRVAQLSNADWLSACRAMIAAGRCSRLRGCHTLQRVFMSTDIQPNGRRFSPHVRYSPENDPARPQLIVPGGPPRGARASPAPNGAGGRFPDINLNSGDREIRPQVAVAAEGPRHPSGRHRVDLPRNEAMPHAVVLDHDGTPGTPISVALSSGTRSQDRQSLRHALPLLRPEEPNGSLNLELDPKATCG